MTISEVVAGTPLWSIEGVMPVTQGNSQGTRGVVEGMTTSTPPAAGPMIANILATWERATEAQREMGAQWYTDAQVIAATLAAQSDHSLDTVAAVIAHLSPQARWAQNVAGATSLLLTGRAPGMMRTSVAHALDALDATDPLATLHGPKTRAFAANILGDAEAVTVDVWAMRVATGSADRKILDRKGGYDAVANAYRRAAHKVGVTPATMQATTWIVARNGRAK